MKDSYVKHIILEEILHGNFSSSFENRLITEDELADARLQLAKKAFASYGLRVEDHYQQISDSIISYLVQNKAIRKSGDEYAGYWYALIDQKKNELIKELLNQNSASISLKSLPESALTNALNKIAIEDKLASFDIQPDVTNEETEAETNQDELSIPASNRIVRLGHNQIENLDNLASDIITKIDSLNIISNDSKDEDISRDIRSYILGGLKAGRELIRAGEFKVYAISVTIVEALKILIKRYENEIIAALATKLIDEIYKIIL